MPQRFAEDSRTALLAADEVSKRRGDDRIGTEHLLVAVLAVGEPVAAELGLTAEDVGAKLAEFDRRALEAVGIAADLEELPRVLEPRKRRRPLLPRRNPFTSGARKALQRSLQICIGEGDKVITPGHLLAALAVGGTDDPAVRVIRRLGVDPAELDSALRRSWRQAS